jgi:tetratricopeptide (TPR) repeat protein
MTACEDFQALWDFDQPQVSEERFRACLREVTDSTARAELLTQVARAQGLQRQFDAASLTLDEAAGLLDESGPRARIRWFLESGRVLNSGGRPADAVPFFKDAWRVALTSQEDYLAVDAAHMLGIAEDDADEQIGWHEWAMEYAERSEDPRAHGWFGSLANNLGWTLHDLGRYDEALGMFERGLEWRRGRGDVAGTRIAAWTVGRCLRSLGRVDEALVRQRELRTELDGAGEDDPYVEEELGECLLALGHGDEAGPHFRRAWEALSRDAWLVEREPKRLERLKWLGGVSL